MKEHEDASRLASRKLAEQQAKRPARITAVWLRRIGNDVQVLVEIDKVWRLAITETADGSFSHIAENTDDGSRWPIVQFNP